MVADYLDARRAGTGGRPVRGGMRERHAGCEHKRGQSRPIDLTQIGGRNAGASRLDDGIPIVVPADDVGTASEQRTGTRQPRPAQPEDGDLFSGKDGEGNHEAPLLARGS